MSDFVSTQKESQGAAAIRNEQQLTLVIHNKETDKYYAPAVLDGLTWETHWKGQPGKLTFKVLKDGSLDFHEGDMVQASYGGKPFFYGFVFNKKRNKDGVITVLAYDQIRYLKNKDTYNFVNQTASTMITRIAKDFELKVGELVDTEYVIPKYRGSNKTLIDIIQDLLDMTTQSTKGKTKKVKDKDGNEKEVPDGPTLYVFYDDFGKLTLKKLEDMKTDLLIDADTAQNFSYESTIDKDTYNKVKLYYDNKETGKRDVWIAQDSANMKRWGVLQLTESINPQKPLNFNEMADTKLLLHNRVKRTLSIKGAFGDLKIRAGSMLYIDINLGEMRLTKQMIVESVTHKLSNLQHEMDLVLKGDVITG